jgi:hypothetical protein
MRRFIAVYLLTYLPNIDFSAVQSCLHLDAMYNTTKIIIEAANWFFNLFRLTHLAPLRNFTVVREQFNAPDHSKRKHDKVLKVVKSFKCSI